MNFAPKNLFKRELKWLHIKSEYIYIHIYGFTYLIISIKCDRVVQAGIGGIDEPGEDARSGGREQDLRRPLGVFGGPGVWHIVGCMGLCFYTRDRAIALPVGSKAIIIQAATPAESGFSLRR